MSLLDILQGAGNVLDTPGSVVRGLLAGQADKAFGGILDPSQRVSGRDMLDRWGVTDANSGTAGDIGGLVAGVATDPLMWGGGALLRALGKGGSAAAKGVEGMGEAASAAGKAATAAEAGVGDVMMNSQLVPGVSAGPVSPLLNARRNFSVLRDVGMDSANQPTFRAVGGLDNTVGRSKQVLSSANNFVTDSMMDSMNGITPAQGAYSSVNRVASVAADASPGTLRHETMHGLIDNAVRSGDGSGLAMIPRASAAMQRANSPLLNGLGQIAEEAAAYGSEGRGPMRQMSNMLSFLDNPTSGYASQFSQVSPLAAKLYAARALPNAGRLAGAGAAGAGYAGINALSGD